MSTTADAKDPTLPLVGPYHQGEIAVQRETGERDAGVRHGRGIADAIVPGAVDFIAGQSLAVIATIDNESRPWCSGLAGPPSSFMVVDPCTLTLDCRAAPSPDDPLWDNLHHDTRVGLLFIDVATRRRYRVNGHIDNPNRDPLVVAVTEAYPNCPKYIQRRHLIVDTTTQREPVPTQHGANLGRDQRHMIESADTFFVASANPDGNLDASHRGGNPGFVRLDGDALQIPDYPGNSMFNTLGNLAVHPRAGLLFINFNNGDTLQLTGTTELDLEADDLNTGGTRRAWTLAVTAWRQSHLAATLRSEFLDSSPHNPGSPRTSARLDT